MAQGHGQIHGGAGAEGDREGPSREGMLKAGPE